MTYRKPEVTDTVEASEAIQYVYKGSNPPADLDVFTTPQAYDGDE